MTELLTTTALTAPPKIDPGFRLIKAEVLDLTPELAQEMRDMPASPTERLKRKAHVEYLRHKAERGLLITFHWAIALLNGVKIRMNAQHSSDMLCGLNGAFPKNTKVFLETYEVANEDALALLFRQFDDRRSARSPSDVAGAYQGLQTPLINTNRQITKLCAEAICWYQGVIEEDGDVPYGDDRYVILGEPGYHDFIIWCNQIFSIKTPEMRHIEIVAAMYGTFEKNQDEAKMFWNEVRKGEQDFDEESKVPATVLDNWLRDLHQECTLSKGHRYQGCAFAWNAYRAGKEISTIKYDTRKGYHNLSE